MKNCSSNIFIIFLLVFYTQEVKGQLLIDSQVKTKNKKSSGSVLCKSDSMIATICEGNIYFLGHQPIKSAGVYTHTFSSKSGCDSIITVYLNVLTNASASVSMTLYSSQLPAVWNGIKIPAGTKSAGAFAKFTTYSTEGCDSIVTLNLTIIPAPPIVLELPLANRNRVILEDNVNTGSIGLNKAYKDVKNNDSLVKKVNIATCNIPVDTTLVTICRGEIFQYNGDEFTEPGIYRSISKGKSVDSVSWLKLMVHERPEIKINFDHTKQICIGDYVKLEAAGANGLDWWCDNKYFETGKSISVQMTQNVKMVEVRGIGQHGCSGSSTAVIRAESCCLPKVPNFIEPNSANTANVFGPVNASELNHYEMWIYNHSGQIVYEGDYAKPHWNGIRDDGRLAEMGVYFYFIKGYCLSGRPFQSRGRFTLIR